MRSFSLDLTRCALAALMLSAAGTFSQITHEFSVFIGCFLRGNMEYQYEFDSQEILHVDYERMEAVFGVPGFLGHFNETVILDDLHLLKNAVKMKNLCLLSALYLEKETKGAEEMESPETYIYPAEEVEAGVKNTLVCFIHHFYPAFTRVNWTRNGTPLQEGVSLGQHVLSTDLTFRQVSTLSFTPVDGDVYHCAVEHPALDRPQITSWEVQLLQPTFQADVFFKAGLFFGFLGMLVGTVLVAVACDRRRSESTEVLQPLQPSRHNADQTPAFSLESTGTEQRGKMEAETLRSNNLIQGCQTHFHREPHQ